MEKLKEKSFYHIYNRGINATNIFLEQSHFYFFLKHYAFYNYLVFKTYSYCLLRNHFHFLVKVRSKQEQKLLFNKYQRRFKTNNNRWHPHGCEYENFKIQSPSRQLAHLFSRYTKNFNKWNQRTGKLFEQPFKRKEVTDKTYLTHLVCYIHRNPIHHGICKDFKSYPYSSFGKILKDTDSVLEKDEVLNWFGGKEQFSLAHQEMKLKITSNLKIE